MNKLLKKLIGKKVTVEYDQDRHNKNKTAFLIADDTKLKLEMKGEYVSMYKGDTTFLSVRDIRTNESIAKDNFQILELSLSSRYEGKCVQFCLSGYSENSIKITEVENG